MNRESDDPETEVAGTASLPGTGSEPQALVEDAAPALLTSAFRTVGARAVMLAISLGVYVAVARALDPSARGNFALLQALNGLTVVLVNFAIAKSVIYHIGKGQITVRTATIGALVLGGLSGALGAVILIPSSLALSDELLPGIPFALIILAVLLGTPHLVKEYLGGSMIALGRPLHYVLSSAVQPFGMLVLILILFAVGDATFGGVVMAWSVGIVAAAFVALAVTLRYPDRPASIRAVDIVRLGRFGLRAYPILLTTFLNLRIDQFLVRWLTSAAVLGQYAVAVNVSESVLRLSHLLMLALSGAISAADQATSASIVRRFCRWVLMLMTLVALLGAIATPLGVPFVFGTAYEPAVGSVLFLLPGMVFFAATAVIREYFIVQRGHLAKAAIITLVPLVVGSALNFPLTPLLGAAGASIASTIAYGMMFLAALVLFGRDSSESPWAVFAFSREDVRAIWRAMRDAASSFRRVRPNGGRGR